MRSSGSLGPCSATGLAGEAYLWPDGLQKLTRQGGQHVQLRCLEVLKSLSSLALLLVQGARAVAVD